MPTLQLMERKSFPYNAVGKARRLYARMHGGKKKQPWA